MEKISLHKTFWSEPEMAPNRNGYGEGLREAGEEDNRIVALCGDLTESTRTHLFKEAFPERFVQVGVAEQNLASVASGMAAMGKIPFIASYAMFSPGRSWEQVRTTICYNKSNVKIIGAHAGVSVGPDGATHQAVEDIAIMRVIPRMVVIAPCDVHEARRATLQAAKYDGPVYIRLAREKTPVITSENASFDIGKGYLLLEAHTKHAEKVGIIATGTILSEALYAAQILNEKEGIGASVLHMPTIKPLDTDAIDAFKKEHKLLVTVEEHQRAGGLGSAVVEYVSEGDPVRVMRIGVDDVFGESGTPEELIKHHGLDRESIATSIKNAL